MMVQETARAIINGKDVEDALEQLGGGPGNRQMVEDLNRIEGWAKTARQETTDSQVEDLMDRITAKTSELKSEIL